jgi:hypothetical protein
MSPEELEEWNELTGQPTSWEWQGLLQLELLVPESKLEQLLSMINGLLPQGIMGLLVARYIAPMKDVSSLKDTVQGQDMPKSIAWSNTLDLYALYESYMTEKD